MRRVPTGLGVLGGLCLAAAIVCGAVGVRLASTALAYYYGAAASTANGAVVASAEAQLRASYVLYLVAEMTVGGFLVAVIAILAVLAIRHRAAAAPTPVAS